MKKGHIQSKSAVLVMVVALSATILNSQSNWTLRNPFLTEKLLKSIAWTGSTFVVVGDSGTILTSSDCVAWKIRASGSENYLTSVAWTGSQLVALGEDDTMLTSTDGTAWTTRTTGFKNPLACVTWTGDQVVAVGDSGTILTSPEGNVWTRQTSGTAEILTSVTSGNGQILATGFGGVILTSPDGIAWTRRASGLATGLYCATWAGSQFVAAGDSGKILTSPDGTVWTRRISNTTSGIYSVTWTGAQLVAVTNRGEVLTSPDGVTWLRRSIGMNMNCVIAAGNRIVSVGDQGVIATSVDGVSWINRTSIQSANLNSIVWSGSRLVAITSSSAAVTSQDGVSWTIDSIPKLPEAIAWTGKEFVTIFNSGKYGYANISPDGLVWKSYPLIWKDTVTSPFFPDLSTLLWTGNQFVAAGTRYGIFTSPDGISWTERYENGDNSEGFLCGAKTNGYTVLGGDGVIYSSSDEGVNWRLRFGNRFGYKFRSMVWNGTMLLAVGDNVVHTSQDNGMNWTQTILPGKDSLNAVTWTGSQFVAVGKKGVILSSPNGTTWTHRFSPTGNALLDITCIGDKLVAVGANGVIITAPRESALTTPRRTITFSSGWSPRFEVSGHSLLISAGGIPSRTAISFRIYNSSGKLVRTFQMEVSMVIRLPLGQLGAGGYILRAETGDKEFLYRFALAK